jgi:hypothetical protein
MSVYKGGTSYSANEDAAQSFLDDKLSKNKYNSSNDYSTEGFDPSSYTSEQLGALNASGGAKKFGKKTYNVVSNQDEIDAFNNSVTASSGGGTSRYSDYENSNNGETAFTDTWQDGAKYQQLRGSGNLTNKDFDAHFASAKGGADTGTVADDGGGWKLIKTDSGEKTNERKLEYKEIASQWQAAGYDVRVQDHNPDFEGGTGEIAVRVGAPKKAPEPKEELVKIEHSPEIQQAKARVGKYQNDILSGKTSQDIYDGADDFYSDYQLKLQGTPNPMGNSGNYRFDDGALNFNGSDISAEEKTPAPVQAASSFLDNQKKKAIKDFNIKPTN